MTLEIFPYIFSRYASLPASQFNKMAIAGGEGYLSRWIALKNDKEKGITLLCDLLFKLINKEQDEAQRKLLLNLKRAVFNDRNNAASLTQKLNPVLFKEIERQVSDLNQCNKRLVDFRQEWEAVYDHAVTSGRLAIKALIDYYPFRNGVLLSSKALYQELENFIRIPTADIDKLAWRTEVSLLRYMTRMAYKTSPFSTLTYLGLTTLGEDPSNDIVQPGSTLQSNIRLNNKLLKRIKGLMAGHPVLNSLMSVSLNSSTRLEEGKFSYLMNSANIETFQYTPATAVNSFICDLLSASEKEFTLVALCQELSSRISARLEEIKEYVLKLVDGGLLELNIGCSEIMPDWESKLLDFLRPHQPTNTSASLLSDFLEELKVVKDEFVHCGVAEREILLDKVASSLDKTLSILEDEAGFVKRSPEEMKRLTEEIIEKYRSGGGFEKLPYVPFDYRQESIFYEDTYIRETGTLPCKDTTLITGKLNGLCCRLAGLDIRRRERLSMLDFFKETYGPEGSVSLMDYYQAYCRRMEKVSKELDTQETIDQQSATEPEWKTDLRKVIANRRQDEKGIHLSEEDLSGLPSSLVPAGAYSCFVQFFKTSENNGLNAVVNGLMPGMGKINGRFLHLFDPEIAVRQRVANLSLVPEAVMMELNDGSSFNANIHPPLLDYEIKMPAANTLMDTSKQIEINRIEVTYDASDNRLVLVDRQTGKNIYAFDLCLETLFNRSKLYQLLSHFNPLPYVSYQFIIRLIDDHFVQKEHDPGIHIHPRITYEERIVIRRKGWVVEKSKVPERQPDESEGIFYLRLQQWANDHQIPLDVFIFLRSSYLPLPDKAKDQTTRDDYKPQYISFGQPILVKLFQRLMQKASSHVYLEEVLPAVRPVADHSYRVAEHLIQWYEK